MSLVAAALEQEGITTVCVHPVRFMAERIRAPRSLLVPFPLGYPLGRPNDPALQRDVLEAMLLMLEDPSLEPPALVEFTAEGHT